MHQKGQNGINLDLFITESTLVRLILAFNLVVALERNILNDELIIINKNDKEDENICVCL